MIRRAVIMMDCVDAIRPGSLFVTSILAKASLTFCGPIWAEPFGQVGNHRLKSREVTRHSGIDRVNLAKQNREYQIEAKSDRCDSEQGREPSWRSEVSDFDARKALNHCLHEVPEEYR